MLKKVKRNAISIKYLIINWGLPSPKLIDARSPLRTRKLGFLREKGRRDDVKMIILLNN